MRGKKTTIQLFISKADILHNNKYDYSKVEYINNYTHIKIICPAHGEFNQAPNHHLKGRGCRLCNFDRQRSSKEYFIQKAIKIHNNKYDYSLVNYINCDTNVKIICPTHGIFEQSPWNHRIGGCILCGIDKRANNRRLSAKGFIILSKKIHGNKYDYSLVEYFNTNRKVKIVCNKHGIFEQSPTKHIHAKQGCPSCSNSKGETQINTFLKKHNIKFIKEKTFENCKNEISLRFDFYLPDKNICIEYDGKQHFMPISKFGGIKEFLNIQKRDKIKTKYCYKNNIKLLRIKYTENIEKILKNILLN